MMMTGYGFRRAWHIAALAAFALAALVAPAAAQSTGSVSGTVTDTSGAAIGGAAVSAQGAVSRGTSTDARGHYSFTDLPEGIYEIVVSKVGFVQSVASVAVAAGASVTADVQLHAQSFSSLRTIARVSTTEPGRAQINQTTAAINTITSQEFFNQGQQQVSKILNETPGIFTTPYNPGNGNPSNGASPASLQTPQIRGALPYETESLIDGHPVSVGSAGNYSPTILNPFLLQDVELVKGPGSMPEEINYAINGTVNYRTLDPTPETHATALFADDTWGGISTGFKATGSLMEHKIGYAVGYVTDGAPGPLENFAYNASQLPLVSGPVVGPYYMNGQQIAMILAPEGLGAAPPQMAKYDGMGLNFVDPIVGCCYTMDTGYHSASQLAKLVFNFSNSTALTVSYLGGQSVNGNGDPGAYSVADVGNTGLPAALFEPCGTAKQPFECNPFAGGTPYSCASTGGGPACGSAIPFEVSSVNGIGYTWTQQNLFQGEFRTTLGNTGTILARYYTGSLNQYDIQGPASGSALGYTLMNTYGTIPLCPAGTTFDRNTPAIIGGPDPNGWMCLTSPTTSVPPVNTTFTGQQVTFLTPNEANLFYTTDSMRGETLSLQELLGENAVTLAYDRSEQGSSETATEPSVGIIVHSPVAGSNQTFQTISLRDNVTLGPNVVLNVGDYAVDYLSHYSINGGVTWHNASHTYNEPRAAFTWSPNYNTFFRLSAGGSVAPPYISLISSGGPTWSQIIGGVPAAGWIQNANNGNINAETAWGYDFGIDHRLNRATAVSLDLYYTQLRNMFLDQTSVVSGAAASGCPNQPCEVTETANLGHARYEGVEFSVYRTPAFGFGWRVQGSLQRAYTYDLPPFFYCAGGTVPPGPGCAYNTNLAVLPNVNFGGQPTALAGSPNGIGSARVPYAMGYGELNWTGAEGQYYELGATYYGNNNAYNEPPFFVVSGGVRVNLTSYGTQLQLTGDNLTGQYANPFVGFFNGIPLPLVKGATQINPLTGAKEPAYFALTPAGNYGPTTFRLTLVQNF
jgi:hypothetical protein